MSEKINQNFKIWSEIPFDKDTQKETINLKLNNIENFNDSFYKDLEFGTGGMRGIMIVEITVESFPLKLQTFFQQIILKYLFLIL